MGIVHSNHIWEIGIYNTITVSLNMGVVHSFICKWFDVSCTVNLVFCSLVLLWDAAVVLMCCWRVAYCSSVSDDTPASGSC